MFVASADVALPGVMWPGQRITSGTRIDSSCGVSLNAHRCSPTAVPLSLIMTNSVSWSRAVSARALTPAPDARPIDELPHAERLGIVLGAEGPGVSERWLAGADQRVRIPLPGAADSLNVSNAAAIACYVLA